MEEGSKDHKHAHHISYPAETSLHISAPPFPGTRSIRVKHISFVFVAVRPYRHTSAFPAAHLIFQRHYLFSSSCFLVTYSQIKGKKKKKRISGHLSPHLIQASVALNRPYLFAYKPKLVSCSSTHPPILSSIHPIRRKHSPIATDFSG